MGPALVQSLAPHVFSNITCVAKVFYGTAGTSNNTYSHWTAGLTVFIHTSNYHVWGLLLFSVTSTPPSQSLS